MFHELETLFQYTQTVDYIHNTYYYNPVIRIIVFLETRFAKNIMIQRYLQFSFLRNKFGKQF